MLPSGAVNGLGRSLGAVGQGAGSSLESTCHAREDRADGHSRLRPHFASLSIVHLHSASQVGLLLLPLRLVNDCFLGAILRPGITCKELRKRLDRRSGRTTASSIVQACHQSFPEHRNVKAENVEKKWRLKNGPYDANSPPPPSQRTTRSSSSSSSPLWRRIHVAPQGALLPAMKNRHLFTTTLLPAPPLTVALNMTSQQILISTRYATKRSPSLTSTVDANDASACGTAVPSAIGGSTSAIARRHAANVASAALLRAVYRSMGSAM